MTAHYCVDGRIATNNPITTLPFPPTFCMAGVSFRSSRLLRALRPIEAKMPLATDRPWASFSVGITLAAEDEAPFCPCCVARVGW